MIMKSLTLILLVLTLLAASCSDKSEEPFRSDKSEIARLITDDADSKAMFPQVWIDTTTRAVLPDSSTALDVINPEDYSVELLDHARGFVFRDSCTADTLIGGAPCASAPLEGSLRAQAMIVEIHDTITCRYHVISALNHEVAVSKNVTMIGKTWVLAALLGLEGSSYSGWDIYAIARQRQAENYVGQVPYVDSIVLRPRDGNFVYRPRKNLEYLPNVDMPQISAGESFTVTIFTQARSSNDDNFFEVYLHQREGDLFLHERKGFGAGGRFNFQVTEKSGAKAGEFGQFVFELFPFTSLRDDSPIAFGTYLQAIAYRVK